MRFRELADNISKFAWMADQTGSLFWFCQRWYDYTGTTIEEMLGWGWQKAHYPDHFTRVTEKFKAAVAAGTRWEDTFPLRSKNSEWRWFLSRARPIHDEKGQIIRWFVIHSQLLQKHCGADTLDEQSLQFLGYTRKTVNCRARMWPPLEKRTGSNSPSKTTVSV
jgi:PAS domain S-box-containing protein